VEIPELSGPHFELRPIQGKDVRVDKGTGELKMEGEPVQIG
jgi:hypothetical protein